MRISQNLGRRWRDDGSETDVLSHGLLLRAGYVRQHAAGIYSYLHLGLRSLRRIEAVVRDEMDRSGAQEVLVPVVHSADVWRRTGRYYEVDETMVRFKDRRGRDMVLGMTHEEIVAELASRDIKSYRDAGIVVYQIQTKFRGCADKICVEESPTCATTCGPGHIPLWTSGNQPPMSHTEPRKRSSRVRSSPLRVEPLRSLLLETQAKQQGYTLLPR